MKGISMRSDYEERKARRIKRLEALADKNEKESASRFQASRNIAGEIPMGQPILIGHHSEKRHRAAIKRSQRHMEAGVEAYKKAKHFEQRAQSAASNTAISSDDPNAIEKLEAKLADLERRHAHMLEINRVHRLFKKNPDAPKTLQALASLSEHEQRLVRTYVPAYSWEPHPHPSYQLTNSKAEISRLRKRIEDVRASLQAEHREHEVGPVRVVENPDENRVQIFLPDRPGETLRRELKGAGFRWAPSVGAWQKHLKEWHVRQALTLAEKYDAGE